MDQGYTKSSSYKVFGMNFDICMNSKIVHDLFLFFDDSEAIEMSEGAVTNDVDAKEAVMMV